MEVFSNTLTNIFRNYITNKKVNLKYGEAPWINKNTKSALCKRSRLTKRYSRMVKCKVIITCY